MSSEDRLNKMIRLKNLFKTATMALFATAVVVTFMYCIATASVADVVGLIGNIIGSAILTLIVYAGLAVMVLTTKRQAEKEEESDT